MLHTLHIENFKSLKSVSLRLQQVNLLIGPNNSGKTNLLKALELWGKIMMGENSGITESELLRTLRSVTLRGKQIIYPFFKFSSVFTPDKSGYKIAKLNIALTKSNSDLSYQLFYGETKQFQVPSLSFKTSFQELDNAYDSFLLFSTYKMDMPENFYQDFTTAENEIKGTAVGDEIKGAAIAKNSGFYGVSFYSPSIPRLLNSTSIRNNSAFDYELCYEYLEGAFIYKPDPRKMMSIAPLYAGNERLLADASNMVAFLDTMLGKYPEVIRAMEQDLERCVGDFIGIRLNPEDVPQNDDLRKIHGDKTFKRLGLKDKRDVIYWADELSEGTLYFLALLAIVHQPNPPKLLMLEEPETAIHPRRIREVLDLIFGLAQENDIQVIMTTHSPLVVDAFAEIPEAIHVVDIDNGETSILNLQYDIIAPAHADCDAKGLPRINYTESLGEHWSIGFLGGVPK